MLDDLLEGNEEKGPGEPDPEADLRDYEAELTPSVQIPEAPSPSSPADVDAPAELQRKFWVLVLAFNGALLAGSLGGLYVVFRNDWYLGGRLLAAGLVCFLYGAYRLRTWDLPRGDGTKAVSASTPAESTDADGPTGGDEETAPAATTDGTGDDKD
ncbi:DUF7322 domain-containing protein [Haloarchaeobius iranensis]|uniref:DUF7322 domain-containing protein n=1 Tax=Haloarchaeobius iranensis TaxID=996166 RepID=A0A1G9T5G4_9EURY|nr:hypothetical protein [Haloarchaeobius iranensis]SDM42931.1 hypothetical protein SAMN05192554_102146 [Haloarchaeobius iranensis]